MTVGDKRQKYENRQDTKLESVLQLAKQILHSKWASKFLLGGHRPKLFSGISSTLGTRTWHTEQYKPFHQV
jgi:hypothetical protein